MSETIPRPSNWGLLLMALVGLILLTVIWLTSPDVPTYQCSRAPSAAPCPDGSP